MTLEFLKLMRWDCSSRVCSYPTMSKYLLKVCLSDFTAWLKHSGSYREGVSTSSTTETLMSFAKEKLRNFMFPVLVIALRTTDSAQF